MAPPARPRSGWPFPRDAAVAARIASLRASVGPSVEGAIKRHTQAGERSLVSAAAVATLVREQGLTSARELALLALPVAGALARPPISDYHVGAVALTTSGELLLGGNLEFPHASIHHTVHAEGFVTLRSRALGLPLDALAISEARPCAHCRQVLAEMAWADGLRLIDPFGADVGLWDLYPAAFVPGDLGMPTAGATAGGATAAGPGAPAVHVPDDLPEDVLVALHAGAARVHAPYSGEPAVVVVRADGRLFTGAVLESVAFNPTIGPLQDALVGLVAAGVPFDRIERAWLVTTRGARVAHEWPTRELLGAVAPDARLDVTYWR